MYLLAPFICKKFKKFLEPSQTHEDVPFSGQKWSICPEQIFFGKPLLLSSMNKITRTLNIVAL